MIFSLPNLTFPIFAKELLPAIALPNVGGFANALSTKDEVTTWYRRLRKPSWTPPDAAFGPVWVTLYSAMGATSWMIYRSGGGFEGAAKVPLILYGTQLALNWIWTPLFFKMHKPGLALVDIGALWMNIAACIYTFYPVNRVASYLMMPYLAWVSLATALNFWIWKENPNADKLE